MPEPLLSFNVYGDPAPQGSKKAVGRTANGRVILVESSKKVKPWREVVRAAAINAIQNREGFPLAGPLQFSAWYTVPAPKYIPEDRDGYPCVSPDLDKIIRSTWDALKHLPKKLMPGVIGDDGQIISIKNLWEFYPNDPRHPESLDRPGAVIHLLRPSRQRTPHQIGPTTVAKADEYLHLRNENAQLLEQLIQARKDKLDLIDQLAQAQELKRLAQLAMIEERKAR